MEKNKNVAKFSSSAGEVGGQAGPRAELSHLRAKHHDHGAAQPGFCWVTLFSGPTTCVLGCTFSTKKTPH